MRKSSRFWWLPGAILLSAMIGCRNSGNYGGPGMSGPVYNGPAGAAGPIAGAGPTMYSGSYPGTPGMTSTPSYSSSPGANYAVPNASSGVGGGSGTR